MLEAGRQDRIAPTVRAKASDFAAGSLLAVPPLYLPPAPFVVAPIAPAATIRDPLPLLPPVSRPSFSNVAPAPSQPMPPNVTPAAPTTPLAAPSTSSVIVYDGSAAAAPASGDAGVAELSATAIRARPATLRDRSRVVPQGTLIAAVLETALDSTQAGQARALVSSDVANLAGGPILIPRGSRLFGDYKAELGQGQNRVQIIWTRLVRPDGATVALSSPAVDRLGRAGVKGSVNTYFLERLGNALLQSSLDIGAAAAGRSIQGGSVVVALPGSVSNATSQFLPPVPKPTIRVRAGTRIGVLVARDLDFSGVNESR